MSISRSSGYADPNRKRTGEQGQSMVQQWLNSTTGRTWTEIKDERNYFWGDLEDNLGNSVEVKTQPINTHKYDFNFIEIFEETHGSNIAHLDGLQQLSSLLDIDCNTLRKSIPITNFYSISVSLEPLRNDVPFIYVNNRTGQLVIYSAHTLRQLVREQILMKRVRRGMGDSNEDTFAVLVNYPPVDFNATQPVMSSLIEDYFEKNIPF